MQGTCLEEVLATMLCWYWKAKTMGSEHEAGQEGHGLTTLKNEVISVPAQARMSPLPPPKCSQFFLNFLTTFFLIVTLSNDLLFRCPTPAYLSLWTPLPNPF